MPSSSSSTTPILRSRRPPKTRWKSPPPTPASNGRNRVTRSEDGLFGHMGRGARARGAPIGAARSPVRESARGAPQDLASARDDEIVTVNDFGIREAAQ